VLVGHSGAGVLLPLIRELAARPVAAYVFDDAGLPAAGAARMGAGAFADGLRAMYAAGRRFPEWTDAQLEPLVPDPARRARLLRGVRPQPWGFWEETIPLPTWWPDAPCAYLRFAPNPSYDGAAAEARHRGWPYAEIAAGHFHMLLDPASVAEALLDLVGRAAPEAGHA
jgi:hypothetical protein